jgi:hypothetical protein
MPNRYAVKSSIGGSAMTIVSTCLARKTSLRRNMDSDAFEPRPLEAAGVKCGGQQSACRVSHEPARVSAIEGRS